MDCVVNTTVYLRHLNYPGETSYYKSLHALDYVKIVFISLIIVGTLVGNIFVIAVIGLNKAMRTVINIYMVNLATTDLLVCSICLTSFLWKNLLNNHIFILGRVMCKLIHFCKMITLVCSVLTLSAIACDRANAILFPLRILITKKKTKLVVLVIWLVSISVSVPLLFVRTLYTIHFKDFVQENCGDLWPSAFNEKTNSCQPLLWVPQLYYTFLSVTLFFVPVSIMTVTYSLILCRLAKAPPGEENESQRTILNKKRKKVIKMVFTVLIVFVICWMPIQIILLYDKYRTGKNSGPLPFWYEEAARVAELLAFSNSFLNPIIYGGFTKEFRDNLFRFLRRCSRRRRRFSSSGLILRFRTTLTTALSSSLRTTNIRSTKTESQKREMELPPTAGNGTLPCADATETDAQKVNEAVNDIPL